MIAADAVAAGGGGGGNVVRPTQVFTLYTTGCTLSGCSCTL